MIISQYLEPFDEGGRPIPYDEAFRIIRAEMGLTREELAQRIGVSFRRIEGIEQARWKPGLMTLQWVFKEYAKFKEGKS